MIFPNMNVASITEALLHGLNKAQQYIDPSKTNGKLVIASFGEDPASGRSIHPKINHFNLGDISRMIDYIGNVSSDEHRNIYMPYALMRSDLPSNKKGSIKDIVSVFGLCADFDDDRAHDYLKRLPMEPDFVLETSKGRFQAVYLFASLVEPEAAIEVAKLLKDYSECDTGTKDISHVWRINGTLNWPNSKKVNEGRSSDPQLVKQVFEKQGGPTIFEDLKESLKSSGPLKGLVPKKIFSPAPAEREIEECGINIQELPIKQEIKDLILLGQPKGDRSEALWKVICSLAANGFTDEDIVDILLSNPIGAKAHEKKDPVDWLKKQMDRGRQWIAENSSQSNDRENFTRDLSILDDALIKCETDPSFVYDAKVVHALSSFKKNDQAKYQQYLLKFKAFNGITIGGLEKAIAGMDHSEKSGSPSHLMTFLKKMTEIFRDPEGTAYLKFKKQAHEEVYPVGSKESDRQISYMVYKELGEYLNDNTLKTVNRTLSSIAMNEGETRDVFLRYGKKGDSYYFDLCNDEWQQVEINKNGVKIIDHSPVIFRRTRSMKSLPMPEAKGNPMLLFKYINVEPKDQLLILAFIMESYRPDTQYVLLEIIGSTGSGKSAVSEFLRLLIDPNKHLLIAAPKNYEDIFVNAKNNGIVCYNNVSRLTSSSQDAFCVLCTGGSLATRHLFSNFDEIAAEAQTPTIINGIPKLVTRKDLAQRTISIELPEISRKIPESQLKEEFNRDWPKIFRGLLDLFCDTLKILPSVEAEPSARMGDFAMLGEAVSLALGHEKGTFMKVYRENQSHSRAVEIDKSPVASAIVTYFDEDRDNINRMQCKELHKLLEDYTSSSDEWPENSKAFKSALMKVAPTLSELGITIDCPNKRTNKGYIVSITKPSVSEMTLHDEKEGTPMADSAGGMEASKKAA